MHVKSKLLLSLVLVGALFASSPTQVKHQPIGAIDRQIIVETFHRIASYQETNAWTFYFYGDLEAHTIFMHRAACYRAAAEFLADYQSQL